MKSKNRILAFGTSLFAFSVLPLLTRAAYEVESGLSNLRNLFPTGGLNNATTAGGLIYEVIRLMLTFAGAVAVLFVILGGFWYITSAGNAEQAEKGKNTAVNAIIGIVIIVLSYVIISVVVNTISKSGGFTGF